MKKKNNITKAYFIFAGAIFLFLFLLAGMLIAPGYTLAALVIIINMIFILAFLFDGIFDIDGIF